jgi:hypothetical protein
VLIIVREIVTRRARGIQGRKKKQVPRIGSGALRRERCRAKDPGATFKPKANAKPPDRAGRQALHLSLADGKSLATFPAARIDFTDSERKSKEAKMKRRLG